MAHSTTSTPSSKLTFHLDQSVVRSSNARTGQLFLGHEDESSRPSDAIQTPAIVSYTKKGAPVHLSRDNVDRLPIEMVMLAYEHFIEYNPPMYLKAPFGLKRYLGLRHGASVAAQDGSKKSRQPHVIFANLRDAADQAEIVGNTEANVACRSFRGVNRVTAAKFAEMTFPKPPDVLLALADEPIGQSSTEKRIQKSLTKSERWLLACLKNNSDKSATNIFAPLVGGIYPAAREEYARTINPIDPSSSSPLLSSIAGYSLNLNSLRPPNHAGLDIANDDATTELASASFDYVDREKIRLALCPNGPHEILALVASNGVDLFMDEWSSAMSSIGIALDFLLESIESAQDAPRELGINLFDDKYAKDFSPLAGPTTAKVLRERYGAEALGDIPTKAYLHHLLHTHEMTSHVLLAMHNTCIMDLFATSIRESIKAGTFKQAREGFEKMYTRRVSAWSEATAQWSKVNKERGKGRLKGFGLERKSDGEATPPLEQERMSFDDPEDKAEKRLRMS